MSDIFYSAVFLSRIMTR